MQPIRSSSALSPWPCSSLDYKGTTEAAVLFHCGGRETGCLADSCGPKATGPRDVFYLNGFSSALGP